MPPVRDLIANYRRAEMTGLWEAELFDWAEAGSSAPEPVKWVGSYRTAGEVHGAVMREVDALAEDSDVRTIHALAGDPQAWAVLARRERIGTAHAR